MDARAARWLTEVLGSGYAPVRSLSFGITSELELVEADGTRFVLRHYTDRDQAAQPPVWWTTRCARSKPHVTCWRTWYPARWRGTRRAPTQVCRRC